MIEDTIQASIGEEEEKTIVPLAPIETASNNTLERVSSGTENLDKLIEGGFGKNSSNLIIGKSGSGKSIFAIQFLIEGLKNGENVLCVSLEEKKDEFYSNMLEFGWNLKKLEEEERFFFLTYTPEKIKSMLEEGGGDIETVVLTKNIKRISMDSITSFIMLFDREVDTRDKTLALFSLFKNWGCTSVFTYEANPINNEKKSLEILESEVDSIIFFYFRRTNKNRERFLEIYKMRGTNHSTEIFPYTISKISGIKISTEPSTENLI